MPKRHCNQFVVSASLAEFLHAEQMATQQGPMEGNSSFLVGSNERIHRCMLLDYIYTSSVDLYTNKFIVL